LLGKQQVYIVLSDDKYEKMQAMDFIRTFGGTVATLENRLIGVRESMVDFAILSCATGIVQSVANDGHSSFSYLASFLGGVQSMSIPILNVHPQPTETLFRQTSNRFANSLGGHVSFSAEADGTYTFIKRVELLKKLTIFH